MVGQGLRFALARVVSRPKQEKKHRSKSIATFTCLQGYATVSTTFLETAQRVITKRIQTPNESNNYKCPLLRADTLEELDWSMGIDVDTSSKARQTIGHAAELFLKLWEFLLYSCEQMLHPSLESTTDFGEKMKWEKTELVIVKIMERREFNKVYEAYLATVEDVDNRAPTSLTSSQQGNNNKKNGFLHRRSKSVDLTHEDSQSSDPAISDAPFASDPLRLLSKYMELLHRTLLYASNTDIRTVMASTIYNSVFSIAFCRFPRANAIILDAFDSKGFNGARAMTNRMQKEFNGAKRTFFEDDNPALFGWRIDNLDPIMLQPYLDGIYECIYTNLQMITEEQSNNPKNNSDDASSISEDINALDDLIDHRLREHQMDGRTLTHSASTMSVSMFLALWIAMTHHILRTSRGHIPWRDIPAYRHLHDRGILLFEKAYAMQTLECDDDSNLVRYDMVAARREKLDRVFPVEILYPQVVFATSTKIISLTRMPHDFMTILFKYTTTPFVRAVPACVGHLENWIGVLPTEIFSDKEIHVLFVKHVRKILKSDRVDRLKAMLIFLLHCTGLFDQPLQKDILSALHDSFSHLFRHWFRDVRFCYHLVLLYLFGDRRRLGSRSDVILLGLDTEDIMNMQRHSTWLPFDEKLLEALETCRDLKRTSPYDRTSFNEYISQLEHYHQTAETLPEGEAVPIPRIKLQQSRGG